MEVGGSAVALPAVPPNCCICGVRFRVTIESDEDGVFVAIPGFARLCFPRENARRSDGEYS